MSKSENIKIPRYLKGLLLSLLLIVVAVPLLRWAGLPITPLSDETPKVYIIVFAHLIPILCLLLDRKTLKSRFLAIEPNDRLPLVFFLTAQMLWFYRHWLCLVALVGYLAVVAGKFYFSVFKSKTTPSGKPDTPPQEGNLSCFLNNLFSKEAIQYRPPHPVGQARHPSASQLTVGRHLPPQRAKEIPIYLWCIVALFFLNAIGVLWQTQDYFLNPTDKYIMAVLLPVSLLFYKPSRQSIYKFAGFSLPFVLAFLSIYLINVAGFHLVYFNDLSAWFKHPLSRIYQADIFNDDTFKLITSWLQVGHPSYTLLALLPSFLILFFLPENKNKSELIAFTLFSLLFVGVTHLRYGLFFVISMSILWLYKPYLGKIKEIFQRYFYIPLIIIGLLAIFVYTERDLFRDNIRFKLYTDAIEQIKLFPLLGQGSWAESRLFFNEYKEYIAHAHNMLLSMMVNFGIIGLLWCLTFVGSILYDGLRFNKPLLTFFVFLLPLLIIESPFTLAHLIDLMLMLLLIFSLSISKNKLNR